MGEGKKVDSSPYAWPYDGDLRADNTALLIIDMQVDFCGKGGYVDLMGYDLSLTQAPVPHIQRALAAARAAGWRVVHTREGHRPQLVDLPANKRWRSRNIGAGIGDPGPAGRLLVRGEPGWEIIPALAPLEGEVVVDKPGKGCFYATDLDLILRTCGIRNLVLTGVTTDVCVHTTLRDANDMGYECLLLSDAMAATDPANHAAALSMVQKQGGVFGAVATTDQLLAALGPLGPVNGTANAPQSHPLAPSTPTPAPTAPLSAKPAAATPGTGVVAVVSDAQPYAYQLPVSQAALVMIDFQRDFMEPGGFGAALGNDVGLLQACVPAAQVLLGACRAAGMLVVHTQEAHKDDLSDLHPCKLTRGNLPAGQGLRIGEAGPMGRLLVRGEPGNDIIPEVAPVEGELVVYKPGKGAFYATDLEQQLRRSGITHLLFAGVTTEVCVQTSMREANDRGFECCLVADASASYFPAFKASVCDMVVAQGGIVGWVASSSQVAAALEGA